MQKFVSWGATKISILTMLNGWVIVKLQAVTLRYRNCLISAVNTDHRKERTARNKHDKVHVLSTNRKFFCYVAMFAYLQPLCLRIAFLKSQIMMIVAFNTNDLFPFAGYVVAMSKLFHAVDSSFQFLGLQIFFFFTLL